MLTRKKLQRHMIRLCFEQFWRFMRVIHLARELAEKTKWVKE